MDYIYVVYTLKYILYSVKNGLIREKAKLYIVMISLARSDFRLLLMCATR